MLFFSPVLRVETVVVSGESIVPTSEYEVFVREQLAGRYLQLFPRNNFFFLPKGLIQEGLRGQYPKLSRVTVIRSFPETIRIALEEDSLLLRWCAGGPCHALRDGKALSIPHAEDPRYDAVRLSVIDMSARPVAVGSLLPVAAHLETFSALWTGFPSLFVTALQDTAFTPSRHSDELSVMTEEGWRVLFPTNRSAESSLGALRIFLAEYKKDHPDRSALAWIDLRVEGKVFFADKGNGEVQLIEPISVDLEEKSETKKQDTKKKKDIR